MISPDWEPAPIEVISREEFIEEFIDRFEAGQHAVFLGPTGRGKTLLMRDLVEAGPNINRIGVLLPKGRNHTLDGFGMTVRNWPGAWRRGFHEFGHKPPHIWKLESDPRAGPGPLRGMYQPVLEWARGRGGWLWIIPDLQALSDPKFANVGKDVSWLLLTLREYSGSMWMDAQRPAWIPRESEDQVSYLTTFRNTDEGTQERLAEILSMPRHDMETHMRNMHYHDFLWRDNIKDETFFVRGTRHAVRDSEEEQREIQSGWTGWDQSEEHN
jgi:hypothetical protein